MKITAGTILFNNLCTPSSALENSLHQLLTVTDSGHAITLANFDYPNLFTPFVPEFHNSRAQQYQIKISKRTTTPLKPDKKR